MATTVGAVALSRSFAVERSEVRSAERRQDQARADERRAEQRREDADRDVERARRRFDRYA